MLVRFFVSLQKDDPSEVGMSLAHSSCLNIIIMYIICINLIHFTVKKHQHDTDDDSGIGPSTFTDTKSTTLSEVSGYLPQYSVVCMAAPVYNLPLLSLLY